MCSSINYILCLTCEILVEKMSINSTQSPVNEVKESPSTHTTNKSAWSAYSVRRRNGEISAFDPQKIAIAIAKAFNATKGIESSNAQSIKETITTFTEHVSLAVTRRTAPGTPMYIEDIQDQVELALMRNGEQKVARAYVLYREERSKERERKQTGHLTLRQNLMVNSKDGQAFPLNITRLEAVIDEACQNIEGVNPASVLNAVDANLYDGISEEELSQALVMAARTKIEEEPNYSYVAARLLLDSLRHEALTALYQKNVFSTQTDMAQHYPVVFPMYIQKAVELELLSPHLLEGYDLAELGSALNAKADLLFNYLGIQTLYDRYFIHHDNTRLELPQCFFMRVAMGLATHEENKTQRAIEFYNLLSSFDFMCSTPTLFNSGTCRPQLSSCYLTTIADDLGSIYDGIKENALLSKFAGGLGNDWTPVRAMGAHIKGTNGSSQGVVPFLKVANDTALAVNQGGKRKGAVCAYLETWHLDIEEFLDLRKNTGDDRRRTHDMNTANWVPDLFMQRVAKEQKWTLFSPNETHDLHDLYGNEFEARYTHYEALAAQGKIKSRTLNAVDLWRKMLTMLFETGHPWITFKDPCNIRSPQQHTGVVHSSNLCTEITLNTNSEEIAVCNLGSINLVQHIDEHGKLNCAKLERTITLAMRMLDNVIEYNYYSIDKAKNSNLRHRPVGLGIMGFHDALYKMRIPYSSEAAVTFADQSMEQISYYTIKASSYLAKERGTYDSYQGSLWQQGILPIDSVELLQKERDGFFKQNQESTLDWDELRQHIQKHGMRNSNTMAIAPTATIANICGISQSIEPTYKNLYVKANLSGDFTIINPALVIDLKKEGMWDEAMRNDLKFFDGDLSEIKRVPEYLKTLYATAFEIDPAWLIECASRRQKWIDQAQSLNLYLAEPSGTKLDKIYKLAWTKGLKTTYYLRSLAATSIEKSTVDKGRLSGVTLQNSTPKVCSITDPDCEACQ